MTLRRRGCTLILLTVLCQRFASAQVASAPSGDLPIVGIAGIAFRVGDLEKARRYYQGVLGLAEAYLRVPDAPGLGFRWNAAGIARYTGGLSLTPAARAAGEADEVGPVS